MKHRRLKKAEIQLIKDELKKYLKNAEDFQYGNLWALGGKQINVIYAGRDVLKSLKNFKDIYNAGVIFGEIVTKNGKNKFLLSLEGMSIISKDIVKNYAVVNKKGENLFLYGRDIFKSSILELKGHGKVVVFNKNMEFLGIGNYDGKMIKNVIDKGWYLREGG
ncbi:MAG: ribosome subunit biosis protein [Methanothermococcus sp.]|jgi:60S ribosome subunit biogenesis protein NIP7|uniref:PUA domain-containing protein n=1 Tax=Methanothermococcus TaxID=155862 RepID=UPI00036966AB|nr:MULTISPECIES: NIP7 N-terminal domain-related protein [Methanothermococcus]MDK2790804.1 ribosome subunit biosis protein [Methanothermococcus sp.]MDK2988025.1 ribosome subunit biosis protein [Methanothermococcus sp.]